MEKVLETEKVRAIRGVYECPSHHGVHRVSTVLSTGWGNAVKGWGLRMSSDVNNKTLELDLGVDTDSVEYRLLLNEVQTYDTSNARKYLNRTMRFRARNEGTRPYETERIIASTVLRDILHSDEELLKTPEFVIPMTVIASDHSPSLSSVRFEQAMMSRITKCAS